MKTIYLRCENYNWKKFEYEDLETLKDEFLSRNISIGYRASIGDCASIGYYASIGDCASIGYRASIGDCASIGYGIKLITGIYFNGSNHSVTYVGENKISIGCNCFTVDYWIEKFEAIGKKHNYSEEQIKEYGNYIKTIKHWLELNP